MVGHLFPAWCGLAPLVLLLLWTIAAGVSADGNTHDGPWSTSGSSATGPSAQQQQHESDDEDATSTKRRRLKLITYHDDDDEVIQGEYIVFFRTDLKADEEIERIQQRAKSSTSSPSSIDADSFAVEHTYSVVLNGAALSNVTDAMLAALLDDESVESVEPDRPTRLATITTALSDSSATAVFSSRQELYPRWLVDDDSMTTQDLPGGDPWGLDRLDSPAKGGLDGRYQYRLTGAGVDVFVFDTGLRFDHAEFGGGNDGESRARCGLNLIWDEDCGDNHGHGTHVAGIIGGTTFGVAKEAQLWSVKTLDRNGGGKASMVIAGLEFVLLQRQLDGTDRPAVVNLSLDSGFSNALNAAVDSAVDRGVVVVMAAGNSAADACTRSPSSAARGISVGAVDKDSKKYRDSNVGPCIDIFAYVGCGKMMVLPATATRSVKPTFVMDSPTT
jgi:subtilisin family serine protease